MPRNRQLRFRSGNKPARSHSLNAGMERASTRMSVRMVHASYAARTTCLLQCVTASRVAFRRMPMTVQIVGRVCASAAHVLHMLGQRRVCRAFPRTPRPIVRQVYRRRCVNNPNWRTPASLRAWNKEEANGVGEKGRAVLSERFFSLIRDQIPFRSGGNCRSFCSWCGTRADARYPVR